MSQFKKAQAESAAGEEIRELVNRIAENRRSMQACGLKILFGFFQRLVR